MFPGVLKIAAFTFASSLLTLTLSDPFRNNLLEYRADTFAIQNSSDAELKGGMRLFKARILKNESIPNSIFLNIFPDHPSPKSRLQRIEKELKKRGSEISLNSEDDKQKINDLLTWDLWDLWDDQAVDKRIKTSNFENFVERYGSE